MPRRYTKKVLERLDELRAKEETKDNKRKKLPMRWYILQIKPGEEKQVRRNILRESKIRMLTAFVGKIILPRQKQVELRKSERVLMRRKSMAGYLVCQLKLTPNTRRLFNSTPGSLGFKPDRNNPEALSDDEVALIMLREQQNAKKTSYHVNTGLSKGDTIKVKSGAFDGQQVVVDEVVGEGGENPLIRAIALVLGRPVVIELREHQFTKVEV